jgi:hypothetical protein
MVENFGNVKEIIVQGNDNVWNIIWPALVVSQRDWISKVKD